MLSHRFRSYLSRTPSVFLASLLILVSALSLPLLVHGQMGGMGGGAGGMGGGMGGMGGGMGGMGGGMGGMGGSVYDARHRTLLELEKNPVQWNRPQGEVPFWLHNGKSQMESTEKTRAKLSEQCEVNFVGSPLSSVIEDLAEKLGVQVELNLSALDTLGVSPDSPVTVSRTGTARENLRRILAPLDLTIIVHETSIEITSNAAASSNPVLRTYDLGFVQSDSKNVAAIVNTIEQSIEPDIWIGNGGESCTSVIGQLLVVSATEKAHAGIETLLYRLSPQAAPGGGGGAHGGMF